MNLKKMWKRFWTMNVHNHEGFTLVELIIVIAILAILSSVAVVGYSSYVTKANMQADKTLAAEVENALMLGYYSGTLTGKGYVVLNLDNSAEATENLHAVLEATFGTNWADQLKLKHNGWNVAYTDSPFKGDEIALIGRVENMTETLSDIITDQPGLVGENFTKYMTTELGFTADDLTNNDKVADAAVMYVANGTSSLSPEKQAEFDAVVKGSEGDYEKMFNGLRNVYGSNVMAAAATYAMIVSWCEYEDKLNGNTQMMDRLGDFDGANITTGTPDEIFGALMGTLDSVGTYMDEEAAKGENGVQFHYEDYFANQVGSAVDGFINIMGTVNSAQSQFEYGKVGSCFNNSELQTLFSHYGEGGVVILVETLSDGSLKITNPLGN